MKNSFAANSIKMALAALVLLSSTAASAQGFVDKDRGFVLAPYLWGTSINGTSTVGALPPLDINASFSDIFSNLNMAASLHTEFHFGKWAIVLDPTYLSMEMDAAPPVPIPNASDLKVDVDIWLVEAWASYQFTDTWEVLGGARYQNQEIGVNGLPSPPFPSSPGVKENWTDWFLGTRLITDINDKWLFTWRWDVRVAGDSDKSFNTSVFFNRRIGDSMAVNLGYRYFIDDFKREGIYAWDVTQQGPVVGYTWTF